MTQCSVVSNKEVMTMIRMFFEIVMVLALVGCLFFVTKVLGKENKPDDENEAQGGED